MSADFSHFRGFNPTGAGVPGPRDQSPYRPLHNVQNGQHGGFSMAPPNGGGIGGDGSVVVLRNKANRGSHLNNQGIR